MKVIYNKRAATHQIETLSQADLWADRIHVYELEQPLFHKRESRYLLTDEPLTNREHQYVLRKLTYIQLLASLSQVD